MNRLVSVLGVVAATVASTGATAVPQDEAVDLSEVPVQVPAGALVELSEAGDSAGAEVLLTGDIDAIADGEIDTESAEVIAQAWPSDEVLESQEEGATFTLLPIALTDVDGDGTFELSADPDEIPGEYVGDDGIIDLAITVWDGETVAETSTSVAFDEGDGGFIDPLAVDMLEEARASDDELADAVVEEYGDAPEVDLTDAIVSDQQSVDATTIDKAYTSCTVTLVQRGIKANAKIGESLPVSGQTSWMMFEDAQSVTLGIAVSASGSSGTWTASGTSTKKSSFSQTWAAKSSKRYYRVEVEMGRYKNVCYNVIGGSSSYAYTNYTTKPIALTGGTSEVATTLSPTWSKCASISAGTWRRYLDTGSAYSNSAGLTIPSPVSISVSSKSQYNSTHALYFKQSTSKTLCGNDNYPASASRLRGKA